MQVELVMGSVKPTVVVVQVVFRHSNVASGYTRRKMCQVFYLSQRYKVDTKLYMNYIEI
jgi:hypothetical protein